MNVKDYISKSKQVLDQLRDKIWDLNTLLGAFDGVSDNMPGDCVAKVLEDKTKWVLELLSEDVKMLQTLSKFKVVMDENVVRIVPAVRLGLPDAHRIQRLQFDYTDGKGNVLRKVGDVDPSFAEKLGIDPKEVPAEAKYVVFRDANEPPKEARRVFLSMEKLETEKPEKIVSEKQE